MAKYSVATVIRAQPIGRIMSDLSQKTHSPEWYREDGMNPSGPSTEESRRESWGRSYPRSAGSTALHVRSPRNFYRHAGRSGRGIGCIQRHYILAPFTSVLLHELGHVGVSKRFGIRTLEIVLYPIGGVSRLERSKA